MIALGLDQTWIGYQDGPGHAGREGSEGSESTIERFSALDTSAAAESVDEIENEAARNL